MLLELLEIAEADPEYGKPAGLTGWQEVDRESNAPSKHLTGIQTLMKVAYYRKPRVFAHSNLAAFFSQNQEKHLDGMGFLPIKGKSSYAYAAEHYQAAAEAELPDGQEASILWWGVATNMCFTGTRRGPGNAPYTMREFRHAVSMAEEARRTRNTALFGPDPHGPHSTYVNQPNLMLNWFRDMGDEEFLPKMIFDYPGSGSDFVVTVEGHPHLRCDDAAALMRKEASSWVTDVRRDFGVGQGSDFDEYGIDVEAFELVPDLKTLCVRQLHRADFPCARGHSDASMVLSELYSTPMCFCCGVLSSEDISLGSVFIAADAGAEPCWVPSSGEQPYCTGDICKPCALAGGVRCM